MAINQSAFSKTFGAKAPADKEARPTAKLWLNVGYATGVENKNGEEYFVALGIPVDTQERKKTNSSDATFRQFQEAQNDFLDQLMAIGEKLEGGQHTDLTLTVRLRRAKDEVEETPATENAFIRKVI